MPSALTQTPPRRPQRPYPHTQRTGARLQLQAVCRPCLAAGAFSTPVPNQDIARELVVSLDAVKMHLRSLFAKFALNDVPQNQKRARLAELAVREGFVTSRVL